MMNEISPETTAYVIEKLGRSADRDGIILRVCEDCDCDWNRAEELIRQIERQHIAEIRKRRFPLLMALSVLAFGGGLVWALASLVGFVYPIWEIYQAQSQGTGSDAGSIMFGAYWMGNFWMYFPQFVAGTGFSVSGLLGMRQILRKRELLDWGEVDDEG